MNKFNLSDNSMNIVGKNIKKIRKDKNVTQEDLCARMQVMGFKLSRSDISKLENGKRFMLDLPMLWKFQFLIYIKNKKCPFGSRFHFQYRPQMDIFYIILIVI